MSLKLISLNIETDKHLPRIEKLIKERQPDVLALQEVYEDTLPFFTDLGFVYSFLPMSHRNTTPEGTIRTLGVALLSRIPHTDTEHFYYHTPTDEVPSLDRDRRRETEKQGAIMGTFVREENTYRIGTTHFPVTSDGGVTPYQEEDMEILLAYTCSLPPHIFCGDFNIPRGYNPLYEALCAHYTDAVPTHYQTSIDLSLHRVKDDPTQAKRVSQFMVDYIFTQPPYIAVDVELVGKVSDHYALCATLLNEKSA